MGFFFSLIIALPIIIILWLIINTIRISTLRVDVDYLLKLRKSNARPATETPIKSDNLNPWEAINAERVTNIEKTKQARVDTEPLSFAPEPESKSILQDIKEEPSFDVEPESKSILQDAKEETSFAQNFGTNIFVWLGGIALALACIYLVKYSIENELLTANQRLGFAALLGFVMLGIGRYIAANITNIANGEKISQALIGAALIDFYGCIYTATNIMNVIPPNFGFLLMAINTFLGIVLSVRHGNEIAVLTLVGAFITPGLFETNNASIIGLLSYLFSIVCGFLFLSVTLGWLALGGIAIAISYLWLGIWLFSATNVSDAILVIALFVFAICAVSHFAFKTSSNRAQSQDDYSIISIIALVGGIFMLAWAVKIGGMAISDWIYFGFLSALAIGVAYFEQGRFLNVLKVVIATNLFMAMTWLAEPQEAFIVLTTFNILLSAPLYLATFTRQKPAEWAIMGAATNISYAALTYIKLHKYFMLDVKFFWGIYAIVFAAIALALLSKIQQEKEKYDRETFKKLLAIFAVTIVTFVTAALFVTVESRFFGIVLCAEMATIAWINSKPSHIEALRYSIGILLILLAAVLGDDIFRVCRNFMTYQLFGKQSTAHIFDAIANPFLRYTPQTVLLAATAWLLLKEKESKLVYWVEGAAVMSMMFLLTFFTYSFLADPMETVGLKIRGVLSNLYLMFGLALISAYSITKRISLSYWGIFIVTYAIFRIGMLDFLHFNPLFKEQYVGSIFLFNHLFLSFATPAFLIYLALSKIDSEEYPQITKVWGATILLLALSFVSLNVRQYFHGDFLNKGQTSDAEMYTYSVAWLILGILLALVGAYKENKVLNIASVVIVTLTIAKVFLIDAKELQGLFRVASFLGLGVSLLGLSYFYKRFVFKK